MAAAPRDQQARPLDVGRPWAELLEAARQALAGAGPALLPVAPGSAGSARLAAVERAAAVVPRPGTALVLPTSGSTGSPRLVELGAAALLASASATHARLGGPGRWLLALPLTHVAGWQVVVRSLVAGREPAVPDRAEPAGASAAFARAATEGDVRYTSLVPAQLTRLLDDPDAAAALAHLDAVLLGGAPTPDALRRRATDAGVRVVRTYGMTETCGGCVYDEVPLDGVRARARADGRLLLSGPVLASGFLGEDVPGTFVERDGTRWLRTGDRGTVCEDGRVRVLGRMDDQIITGGVNVTPADVEQVLTSLPGVREVVVVGVPNPRWGQEVVALVAADGPLPDLASVRAAVSGVLGAAAAPRRLVVVDAVPLRGIGKPDRAAAQLLACPPARGPVPA